MNFLLEIVMGIMLDAAMLVLVIKLACKKDKSGAGDRFAATAMGCGFLVYCILKAVICMNYAVLTLAALGFMLSYTAFVFTISEE